MRPLCQMAISATELRIVHASKEADSPQFYNSDIFRHGYPFQYALNFLSLENINVVMYDCLQKISLHSQKIIKNRPSYSIWVLSQWHAWSCCIKLSFVEYFGMVTSCIFKNTSVSDCFQRNLLRPHLDCQISSKYTEIGAKKARPPSRINKWTQHQ